MIKSWPIIEWKLPRDMGAWPALVHANTSTRAAAHGPADRRCGETVWIGVVDGKSIGAAWEWIELRPGVVMISDPNTIITNIRFLDEDDAYQEFLPAVVSVNRLAHVLPWQATVAATLAATPDDHALAAHHARSGEGRHRALADRLRSHAA
jgi:hypothetical protein